MFLRGLVAIELFYWVCEIWCSHGPILLSNAQILTKIAHFNYTATCWSQCTVFWIRLKQISIKYIWLNIKRSSECSRTKQKTLELVKWTRLMRYINDMLYISTRYMLWICPTYLKPIIRQRCSSCVCCHDPLTHWRWDGEWGTQQPASHRGRRVWGTWAAPLWLNSSRLRRCLKLTKRWRKSRF